MKMLRLRSKFWILRRFNKGEPSSYECGWALENLPQSTNGGVIRSLAYRSAGYSLNQISVQLNCTRERVRQLVYTGIRRARANAINKGVKQ